MRTLPIELWDRIVECLLEDQSYVGNLHYEPASSASAQTPPWTIGRRTLACSLAATTRGFYDLIVPKLWRHVVIDRRGMLERVALLALLGPAHEPTRRLGGFTKRLEVIIKDATYDHTTLGTLLRETTDLKVLVLDSYPPHHSPLQPFSTIPFTSSSMTAIARCHTLESLQFRNGHEVPTIQGLCEISMGCPSLNRLQVTGVAGLDSIPPPQMTNGTSSFPSLTFLSIGGPVITPLTRRHLCALMEFFAHQRTSMPRLRSIHLHHHLPDLEPSLQPFADVLAHGELVFGSPTTDQMHLGIPLQYRSLRSLAIKITNRPVHPIPPFPSLEQIQVLQFPATGYSHLYRTVGYRCEQFLVLLLRHPNESLKEITVFVPTRRYQPPLDAYPALARKFRHNGIDLVVHPHPLHCALPSDNLVQAGT